MYKTEYKALFVIKTQIKIKETVSEVNERTHNFAPWYLSMKNGVSVHKETGISIAAKTGHSPKEQMSKPWWRAPSGDTSNSTVKTTAQRHRWASEIQWVKGDQTRGRSVGDCRIGKTSICSDKNPNISCLGRGLTRNGPAGAFWGSKDVLSCEVCGLYRCLHLPSGLNLYLRWTYLAVFRRPGRTAEVHLALKEGELLF